MTQDLLKKRVYKITETCRGAIKRLRLEGHDELTFSAKLTRRGEKLNGVTRAATDHFSQLLRESIRSEDPDRVFVQFYDGQGTELWGKSFALESEPQALSGPLPMAGLGEVEVNHLVQTKLHELRREEELSELRKACDHLEKENEALQKRLEDTEEVLEAKKNVEYYSNIIGLALPGLAKMLGRSPLGSTLGMLAGAEVELPAEAGATDASKEARGQREAIIDLALEFMRSLPDAQLGSLYLVFVELSNNPGLIPGLLAHVTGKPAMSHPEPQAE